MKKQNGPWTILDSNSIYKDDFVEFWVDQVTHSNGIEGTYSVVKLKPGAAVLPVDEEGNVWLCKQFRYATEEDTIEVASGGMDMPEDPIVAAQRELEEEAGIKAGEWIDLGYMHIETSMIKCPVYLYLARNLEFTDPNREATEDIRMMKVTLNEAVQMVMDNEITHGPSCVLILKSYVYLKNNE